MALLTPPPVAPQRGDRATFASRVDAFITWLINFVSELLALVANLNTLAAGGAYAIPFQVAAQASVGGAGGGKLACENSAMSLAAANFLLVDQLDSRGSSCRTLLDEMYYSGNNANAVKGYVKLTKVGDPTQWITFRITSWTAFGSTYGTFSVTCTGYSSINPFVLGDLVIASFERTGDKGDKGENSSSLGMLIRELYSSGTAGPSLTSSTWTTRVLNTVAANTIPGASLGAGGANTFRLPPGTYMIWASAPAHTTFGGNTLKHQLRLYNRTTSQVTDAGTGETQVTASTGGAYFPNRSVLRTLIAFSVTTDFSIDHYSSVSSTGGAPVSTGYGEVYTEILIQKVA